MAIEIEVEMPQRALDVLSSVLVEPYSDEDMLALAKTWEEANGQLLMLPAEEGPDGQPNDKYFQRLADFTPNRKQASISGDPAIFRQELQRLRDNIEDPKTVSERGKQRINELEEALGEPTTDFSKLRTRKQVIEDAKKRFAEYQQQPDFAKRAVLASKEKDHMVLQLLYKFDKSENVRKAAFTRIAELEVVGS